MGLFKRVRDIVTANFNELANEFEKPDLALKQAIREMETTIDQVTRDTARSIANQKTVTSELHKNRQQVETWADRAGLAVDAGDDDLARKALRRKQEHVKLAEALEDQLKITTESATTLRRQLDGMKAKLAEAKRNLATLTARQRAAEFKRRLQDNERMTHLDETNAFAKFEQLKSKVEMAEAEAEAYAELTGSTPEIHEDLDALFEPDLDAEIEAQLEELRTRKK